MGFGITFHQPVDWVSLKAVNYGRAGSTADEDGNQVHYGLPAAWYAFDVNGDELAHGRESGVEGDNRGIVFEMYWDIPGMTSLAVGRYGISSVQFDDLQFKLTQATVPEPGTLGLFGMGLAGLVADNGTWLKTPDVLPLARLRHEAGRDLGARLFPAEPMTG